MKTVSHLNAPLSSENYIYCGTLQLAWNELMDKFGDGPLTFTKPIPEAEELNKRLFEKTELADDCHYETVGFVQDDVVGQIRRTLQEKFRETSRVNFQGLSPSDIIAYAFLIKDFPFRDKYADLEPKPFADEEQIKYFGTVAGNEKGRSQTLILYYNDPKDFAIRIKAQRGVEDILVLARVQPLSSLADTIALVESKTGSVTPMDRSDILRVPAISLDIEHHFRELTGINFLNEKLKDYFIADAVQFIKFLLNKEGAKLRSEAAIHARKCISHYVPQPKVMVFDQPFLLYMKSGLQSRPYFAMWIQDTEFLVKP